MFANGCNHTPPTESTPRRFYFPSEKFRWIKVTTASVRSPAKSFFPQCFESWQSFRSGTGGFQFFFSATNCWKLQIGSSTLWWALGRVDASYLHIKGFWQQQKIRRMQNNMMAWYFGQVLLIKWCLTKSPTFIFYPWNDNRWVLGTVLKSLQWRRKYCLRKYFWASECSKEQLATEALYTRQFFPFLIVLSRSAHIAELVICWVGLDIGQWINDPHLRTVSLEK